MKMNKKCVGLCGCILLSLIGLRVLADSPVKEFVDDAAITTHIKEKLLVDDTVSSSHVSVKTNNGVVSISGTVPTGEEASKVVEIASSVSGVADVDTAHLKVETSRDTLGDSYITAKIKGLYIREKIFGDKDIPVTRIHIETKNGIVYLRGRVDTVHEKTNAEALAKTVKGVEKVETNALKVK